jgi:hypothetical protein
MEEFMNAKEITMKRSTIATVFTIAAVTALALGIAPSAQAQSCSSLSLNGTFVYKGTGTIVSPAALAGPIDEVGTLTFNGNGVLTGSGVLNQGGTANPVTKTGTYTLNPDCTGTITVQYSHGFTSQFFFVIDSVEPVGIQYVRGNELQILCEDAGVVLDGIARRQFAAGGSAQ